MAEKKPEATEPTPEPQPVAEPGTLTLIGAPGSIFNIKGDFGPVGSLTIGHQVITPTSWNERGLRGLLPTDVSGEVKIVNGDGQIWIGHYPAKA